MLRTSARWFCIAVAIIGFPAVLGVTSVAPADPPRNDTNPYDSIRTDLTDYRWPMRTSRVMTSSFGEFRSTHFHAGIDISTGDTVGLPVMASRDGYVSRISVSPNGYGKILHIRHADRYTTSYAHLQGFPPWIDQLIRAEQHERGCFPVDLDFPANALPVKAGQVVAYAGDTGSGSAHLHFEIRDEHNNGVNPLMAEPFVIEDSLRPQFKGLVLVPIDSAGAVDGSRTKTMKPARLVSPGRYLLDESPILDGAIGFAVDVRDRSDRSNYFHGFHTLSFRVDGAELLGVRYDRVPLREGHQIRLVYLQDRELKRRGRFHKLYIDTYHRLPIFEGFPRESGIIRTGSLPPGKHTFTITCVDYNGNASEFSGTFQVRQDRPIVPEDPGPRSFSATDPPEYTIDPSRSGELLLERGMVRVRYQRNATFHPIHLILTPMNEKGSASFDVEPEGVPLDGGLTFVVKKPAWMNHAGVYTREGPSWEFHSRAETDETGHVTFRLKTFLEDFSIREDSLPPEIRRLRIEGSGRRPRIFFRFRDNLAGVEYESLKLYIDRTMIIPEIDGEHHRATAQPETSLSRGSHRLTIRLEDRMGNSTLVERSFRVQ